MVYTKPFTIARNALGCVETLLKRGDTLRTYTLASLLAATLLAGCSSTNLIDAPSAPTNGTPSDTLDSSDSAGQKAFVFESDTVPIGDFDPFTLAPEDYFDPCNDITEEEFRRAGFTGEIKRSTDGEIDSPNGTSICTFRDPENLTFIGLMSVEGNRKVAEDLGGVEGDIVSSVLPELYAYHRGYYVSLPNTCISQVDTERGGIAAAYYTVDESVSVDEHCRIATEAMEALYLLGNE